jgi:hypothetical protein
LVVLLVKMRQTLLSLVLGGLGASAAVLKRDDCSFELDGGRDFDGCRDRFDDRRCRFDGHNLKSKFSFDIKSGVLRDGNGRGCGFNDRDSRFRCDEGGFGRLF